MAWESSQDKLAFGMALKEKGKARDYIDITYTLLEEKPIHGILSASNLFGGIAFLALLMVPAAVEGDAYVTALVLTVVLAVCAFLSMKEDGRIK